MVGPDGRQDPHSDDGPIDAQIRTFLIAAMHGCSLFTKEDR